MEFKLENILKNEYEPIVEELNELEGFNITGLYGVIKSEVSFYNACKMTPKFPATLTTNLDPYVEIIEVKCYCLSPKTPTHRTDPLNCPVHGRSCL